MVAQFYTCEMFTEYISTTKNTILYLGKKTPEVCRTAVTCELMEGGLSEKDLKVLTAVVCGHDLYYMW